MHQFDEQTRIAVLDYLCKLILNEGVRGKRGVTEANEHETNGQEGEEPGGCRRE